MTQPGLVDASRAVRADKPHARSEPLRVAVVGCGAVAQAFHLPALAAVAGVAEQLIVVDRDRARAEAARAQFDARRAVSDYREVLGDVDGAIVAVPQELHAEVTAGFLHAGIPVLCEKPLATTLGDAVALVSAADAAGTVLAVNNTHRLYPAIQAASEWILSGRLGRIRRIEVYEGGPLVGWPLAGGSSFGRGGTGKGVLQDTGAHALDVVCWWLGERPRITRYLDDAMGGSEAVARVQFAGDGYTGMVHLSWLSPMSNAFRIEGELGRLEGGIRSWDVLRATATGGLPRKVQLRPEVPSFARINGRVIKTFLGAIQGRCRPAASGRDVLPSIAMIEECYARRERFPMPWLDTTPEAADVAA